jgi:hypothetical protein
MSIHWAYRLLTTIDAAVPHNERVGGALSKLVKDHPEVKDKGPREISEKPSAWTNAPSTNIDELHRQINDAREATAQSLIACETESSSFEDQRRWDGLTDAIGSTVQRWPEDGFALLDAVGPGHPGIDQAVVRGWGMAEHEDDLAARILTRIAALELRPILNYVTSTLGGFIYSGTQPPRWFRYPESEQLARICWDAIDPDAESALPSDGDAARSAINHPAGHLAQYWVDRISHLWEIAPTTWASIPPDVADHLAELLTPDTNKTQAVEVVFGSSLNFFFQADETWCKHFLLPRFNWSNEDQARRIWDGYLSHGGWTNQLLKSGLMANMVAAVAHRDELSKQGNRNLPILLARIALDADVDPLDWLKDLVRTGTTDDHVAWADAVAHQLRSLDASAVEGQWVQWMRDYVTQRTNSIPRKLDAREASVIAHWTLFLTDSMPTAIDLVLRTESAGVGWHSLFFHDLQDKQIQQAPEKVAQLIEHILRPTVPPFHYAMDLRKPYELLQRNGVSELTLEKIREASLGLGIELD